MPTGINSESAEADSFVISSRRRVFGTFGFIGMLALVGACTDHRQPPDYAAWLEKKAASSPTQGKVWTASTDLSDVTTTVTRSINDREENLGSNPCRLEKLKDRIYQKGPMKNFVDQHVLIAHPNGGEDQSDAYGEPYWRRFHRILTAFEKSGATKMLIYVNGGNNPKKLVLDQAAAQIPCMMLAKIFPVFLIWETGALGAYAEQVTRIRNGRLLARTGPNQRFAFASSPMYLVADVAQALALAPVTFVNSVARWVDSNHSLDTIGLFRKRAYSLEWFVDNEFKEKNASGENVPKSEYKKIIIDDNAKDIELGGASRNSAFHASDIFGLPFKIVSAPFVASLGKTAWENMKRRSRTTTRAVWEFQQQFRRDHNNDTIVRAAIKKEQHCYPKGAGVFSRFFQDLLRYNKREHDPKCNYFDGTNKKASNLEVTVIGHSMGTIVLNDLISSYRNLPFDNIVYLSAATTIREFERTVPAVLEYRKSVNFRRKPTGCENPVKPQFYSLMLHPLRDARERAALGTVPTGSLLEWIDDMFEGPETILDRTMGLWRNLYPVIHVFDETVRNEQMNFHVFGMLGERKRKGWSRNAPDSFCHSDYYWPADPDTHSSMNDSKSCFWTMKFWAEKRPSWAMGPKP